MLAGYSGSTLLSPRHRLRSEASTQFQACHFQLPSSMNTQRLELPCSFPRKDTSRSQPIEAKTSTCSLKQNIRLPPLATTTTRATCSQTTQPLGVIKDEFWEKGKKCLNLKKRLAEHGSVEESFTNNSKRRKGSSDDGNYNEVLEVGDSLSLAQMGVGNFWFQQSLAGLNPSVPFTLTCSGEEERVFFVPSEVVSSPLPLYNNPWVESAVTKITNFGEKDVEGSQRHHEVKEGSVSNSSLESPSLSLRRLNENTSSEQEVGNGSGNPYHHEGTEAETGEEDEQEEHLGFELVSLLTACWKLLDRGMWLQSTTS